MRMFVAEEYASIFHLVFTTTVSVIMGIKWLEIRVQWVEPAKVRIV